MRKITMIKDPPAEAKDDLSGYVNKSARDVVLITRHVKPTVIPIGFADEDDSLDYRFYHAERFRKRIAETREPARDAAI